MHTDKMHQTISVEIIQDVLLVVGILTPPLLDDHLLQVLILKNA